MNYKKIFIKGIISIVFVFLLLDLAINYSISAGYLKFDMITVIFGTAIITIIYYDMYNIIIKYLIKKDVIKQ